jgi:hypothetical protein
MSTLQRMRMWTVILVLALSVLTYAGQDQAPKKTNDEEIVALKRRVEELEQKLGALEMRVASLHQPKVVLVQ